LLAQCVLGLDISGRQSELSGRPVHGRIVPPDFEQLGEGPIESALYRLLEVALGGAPYHPMTQGKIERWHQAMKNRILLENYYLPSELEVQIGALVDYYNHHRYHESLRNLTPADVSTVAGKQSSINGRPSSTRSSSNVACSIRKPSPFHFPSLSQYSVASRQEDHCVRNTQAR
jgi:hypothetical protein